MVTISNNSVSSFKKSLSAVYFFKRKFHLDLYSILLEENRHS